MIRAYVAGPFTSDPVGNTLRAVEAGRRLAAAGLAPFVPHVAVEAVAGGEYEACLAHCLVWVAVCHALLRLPGASGGADKEVALAERLGIPVFHDEAVLIAWARGA